MPVLPWKPVVALPPGTTALVMASHFRIRSFRHVARFLIDSLRIRRQVRGTDGALGIALIAHPLRREFSTLSAWRDRSSLERLVRTQPHLGAMRRHRSAMAEATFVFWESPAAALPVTWDEARARLDAEREVSSATGAHDSAAGPHLDAVPPRATVSRVRAGTTRQI